MPNSYTDPHLVALKCNLKKIERKICPIISDLVHSTRFILYKFKHNRTDITLRYAELYRRKYRLNFRKH